MSACDCSKEMSGFHSEHVTLSKADQDVMRGRRDNGRTRLRGGLGKAGHPLPKEFASQGSYAMRTMVQDPECDYDIDDGVYFEVGDLKDSNGADLAPLAVRKRISAALKDDRLAFDATVHTNCVRQPYPDGYHIDMPVYKLVRSTDGWGTETVLYQLASGDSWINSDARAVTKWMNIAVGQELKSGDVDYSQLRRVVKLTKKFARSRTSWKSQTTSGIALSKLVVDEFSKVDGRDDDSLRNTWTAIYGRLSYNLQIAHPVEVGKNLTEWGDSSVSFFRDCLRDALAQLKVLDEAGCTKENVLKAWDSVFDSTYFTAQTSTKSLLGSAASASAYQFPDKPIIPNKSSGFA